MGKCQNELLKGQFVFVLHFKMLLLGLQSNKNTSHKTTKIFINSQIISQGSFSGILKISCPVIYFGFWYMHNPQRFKDNFLIS